IVGEFAIDVEDMNRFVKEEVDGSLLIDGSITIRDLNRVTGWHLPMEGPRTLSGLVIEYLEAIPAPGVALRIAGYPMEVVKVRHNTIKLIRVFPALYRAENNFLE